MTSQDYALLLEKPSKKRDSENFFCKTSIIYLSTNNKSFCTIEIHKYLPKWRDNDGYVLYQEFFIMDAVKFEGKKIL